MPSWTMPSWFRSACCSGAAAALLLAGQALLFEASAAEARKAPPADPAITELQRAYESAARQSKAGDSLDSAYELLSLADTAQQYHATKVADGAGVALADLVRRATASALKPPSPSHKSTNARDTLDQFVDLRSAAYSVPAAQTALDDGLRALFPAVAGMVERNANTADSWEQRLAVTSDLALLQASAVQVKMTPIAGDLGQAFDSGIAALREANQNEADATLRARHIAALDDAIKARADHLKDAAANTIDIIAERMQAAGPGEGPGAGSRLAVGPKD